MSPRRAAIVLAAAAGLAWLLPFAFERHRPASGPAGGDSARGVAESTMPVAAPRTLAAPAPPPPASLRDTEIDGALAVSADGHFEPDRGALALFDYFLSATGEEPAAALRARITAEIARRLAPAAAREAEEFLDRYLAYRDAARSLGEEDRLAQGTDLERRLQWLRELRRAHFGATLAERLFGDDERSVAIALERRRIAADATLSPEEKRTRLDALEEELPEAVRRARATAVLPLRLQQEEAALREAGAAPATIRALREEAVGSEAADRLADLDAKRAIWQGRVDAYRAERAAIEGDASIDAAERAARLDALRARHFDATEQLRVRALDEIEASP